VREMWTNGRSDHPGGRETRAGQLAAWRTACVRTGAICAGRGAFRLLVGSGSVSKDHGEKAALDAKAAMLVVDEAHPAKAIHEATDP
jgi:hypothetical protein